MSFVTGRYTVVPPIPLKKEAEKPETKGSFSKQKYTPAVRKTRLKRMALQFVILAVEPPRSGLLTISHLCLHVTWDPL